VVGAVVGAAARGRAASGVVAGGWVGVVVGAGERLGWDGLGRFSWRGFVLVGW